MTSNPYLSLCIMMDSTGCGANLSDGSGYCASKFAMNSLGQVPPCYVGLGRIVALYHCSSTSYHIH
jgi:hypothetical protein